jgi:hypothetical protein
MKNNLLFIAFVILFHHLFWHQHMGLNLALFTMAAIGLHYAQNGMPRFNKHEALFALSYLISLLGLLFINSSVSVVVTLISFVSFYGYLKLRQTAALENFVNALFNFMDLRKPILPQSIWATGQRKPSGVLYTRLAIIPILIFLFYILLFSRGNSIFRGWSQTVFGRFISYFQEISWPYFFFILLGIFIVRWMFAPTFKSLIKLNTNPTLQRIRRKAQRPFTNNALKHEHLMALMLFGSLNALFAIVNFIDVKWVWFQFYVPAEFSLKEFVHDGVGYLIITLLISMGLILFFFRRNLNFYPNSKLLKTLAIVWIVQNGILAVSVVIRTVQYINFHGLASGRIGLMVFLTMVVFGLITLFIKVYQTKNNAYLLRVNSGFALILFTLCATINWDGLIARVNLNHQVANEIDVNNYLNLNPQVYPTIFANLDKVEKQIRYHNNNEVRWIRFTDIEDFKSDLINRSERYVAERNELSAFDSWSYADQRAVAELEKILN